jgi:hypothetical protein
MYKFMSLSTHQPTYRHGSTLFLNNICSQGQKIIQLYLAYFLEDKIIFVLKGNIQQWCGVMNVLLM